MEIQSKDDPVLNYAPRHENVLGRGGITPRILNLGTRWVLSRQFHETGRFTPGERAPSTHFSGGRVGPKAGLDAVAKRKNLFSTPAGDRIPIVQPVALSLY
jgi:hypothetical protein